jgi:hypothetical protein
MSVTMEDIQRRRRMCSEKSRFATEVEAKCFILKKKAALRAYQCPHCNDWHLTKKLTPPCAIEGGSMSTTYAPPPGRPISTPPMPNGHAAVALPKFQLDEDGIVNAYKAGMSSADIKEKFRCSASQLYRLLRERGISIRYPRRPKETETELPAPTHPGRPVREEGESRGRYASRVLAWMRATDPEYDKQVHKNMRQGQLRRARIARVRRLNQEMAPILAPKPLTLWQRFVGWFK